MTFEPGRPDMQAGEETLEKLVGEATVEIRNELGLHMRPAMMFVDLASQFECKVTVSNDKTEVDGKSIMAMSMLAATCGTRLKIRAEGSDAASAIDALRELVEGRNFDEPEPGPEPESEPDA